MKDLYLANLALHDEYHRHREDAIFFCGSTDETHKVMYEQKIGYMVATQNAITLIENLIHGRGRALAYLMGVE